MNCIESLNKNEFSLQEIYKFENDLKIIHPENNNIKAKIRQQLQFLRDKNYLKFLEK
jgi:type II restriction enzyme